MGDRNQEANGCNIEERFGIRIERRPSDSRLSDLGIRGWPKKFTAASTSLAAPKYSGSPRWGCPPGRFQLTFDAEETCYLVRGKVKVYPKGSSEYVEFGANDLVVLPKGLSCTWDVSIAVDKHYKFDH